MARVLPMCLLLLVPLSVIAQPSEEPPADRPTPETPRRDMPEAGFWPTDRMLELAVARFVEDAGQRLELDPEQKQAFEKLLVKRWPPFLKEHRSVLQRVLNEYIEASMSDTPPPRETVQRWATEVLPILQQARTEMEACHKELRDVLHPEQRPKLDAEVATFGLGYQVAEAKLKDWKAGNYREEEWRSGSRRRAATTTKPVQEPQVASATEEADELEAAEEKGKYVPLSKWDAYFERFQKTYELDAAQVNTALSILREVKERAEAYEGTHREELEEIKEKIAGQKGADREELLARQQRLRQPLIDMFDEFKQRLGDLLTAEQRKRTTKPTEQKRPEKAEEP